MIVTMLTKYSLQYGIIHVCHFTDIFVSVIAINNIRFYPQCTNICFLVKNKMFLFEANHCTCLFD